MAHNIMQVSLEGGRTVLAPARITPKAQAMLLFLGWEELHALFLPAPCVPLTPHCHAAVKKRMMAISWKKARKHLLDRAPPLLTLTQAGGASYRLEGCTFALRGISSSGRARVLVNANKTTLCALLACIDLPDAPATWSGALENWTALCKNAAQALWPAARPFELTLQAHRGEHGARLCLGLKLFLRPDGQKDGA